MLFTIFKSTVPTHWAQPTSPIFLPLKAWAEHSERRWREGGVSQVNPSLYFFPSKPYCSFKWGFSAGILYRKTDLMDGVWKKGKRITFRPAYRAESEAGRKEVISMIFKATVGQLPLRARPCMVWSRRCSPCSP
jgi:hypothetical protein